MLQSATISKKFYVFFHLLPFLINLKKNARQGKLPKAFFKALRNYIKSILFIAHLVGGLKLLKCVAIAVYNRLGLKLDGKLFVNHRQNLPVGIVHFVVRNLLGRQHASLVNHLLCLREVHKVIVCLFEKTKYRVRQKLNANMFRFDIRFTQLHLYYLSVNCQSNEHTGTRLGKVLILIFFIFDFLRWPSHEKVKQTKAYAFGG